MNHRHCGVTVILLAGALSAPAYASSLEAFSGVSGGSTTCGIAGSEGTLRSFFQGESTFGLGNSGNGIGDCGLTGGTQDVILPSGVLGPALSSQTYAGVAERFGASFTGSAQATANYGSIGAQASGAFTGTTDNVGTIAESAAYSIVTDQLTFMGGPTGSTGTVTFGYLLNGSLTDSNFTDELDVGAVFATYLGSSGGAFVDADLQGETGTVNGNPAFPGFTFGSGSVGANNTFVQITLPVTYGVSTTYQWGLAANADPSAANGPGLVNQTDSDFINTATLASIQTFDSNGNPIAVDITSQSGTIYGADGVESGTPEPATFLLAACALIGLLCVKKRTFWQGAS